MKIHILPATALLICLLTTSQTFAGFFEVTPVPELDASTGIVAMALVASVAAIFFGRSRNKE